jgi:hypothetical protein
MSGTGLFEQATKSRIRFTTSIGALTTEDLWELPLTARKKGCCLDEVAKSIHRELKDSEEESFVVKATKPNEVLQLKMDVVKHVIKVRLAEREEAMLAAARKEKKQQIMAIIADKEVESLKTASLDELRALLDSM